MKNFKTQVGCHKIGVEFHDPDNLNDVLNDEDDQTVMGLYLAEKDRIYISNDLSPERTISVYLHELGEAVNETMGDYQISHRDLSCLAEGICQGILANKQAFRSLLQR